jgi:hypothetical protein
MSSRSVSEPPTTGPGGPWHATAPAAVTQAYQTSREQGWAAWRKHLAERKLRPLARLFDAKRSPLAWALPLEASLTETLALIKQLDRLPKPARRGTTASKDSAALEGTANTWLADSQAAPANVALVLESLAWCAALPRAAASLSGRLWWSLVDRLVSLAEAGPRADDPLAAQLLGCELPLALAYSFPELEICQKLVETAAGTLAAGLAEFVDEQGMPPASHLHVLRPLVACWTRAQLVDRKLSVGSWTKADRRQYAALVRSALRLTRRGGQQVFTPLDSPGWNPELIAAVRRLAGDRQTRRVLRLVEKGVNPARSPSRAALPPSSWESELAGLAVLRADWSKKSPRLSVAYGKQVLTELSVGKRCLLSGVWDVEVRFNGKPLEFADEWEQVCWESDDDVEYLELEVKLADEVSIQRHMLLAREDGFLLMADAVLGIQQGTIEYRGALPLEGYSHFEPAAETREGSLVLGRRPRARVLPLALPEWRSGGGRGSLQSTARGLELTQSADGQSLFAPLFIDLDARRLKRETTWRQLTVGQDREILPRDVAAGYRVQVGKSQWLVYRSLSVPDVRTVLGANLMHEFLVGRFKPDGHVKTLVEIE